MFRRSSVIFFVLTLCVAVFATTDATAGFWDRKKPETAEQHQHHGKSTKTKVTNHYGAIMQRMHKNMNTPLSGNADIDFVRQMIPHHQAALEMARVQQQRGRDESLKGFNDWVILAQTQEIAMMQNWLRRRDNGFSAKDAENHYGAAMQTMHQHMKHRYSGNADIDYARGMIAHHQAAVDMVSVWLQEGTDPDLKQLTRDIYDAQTQEIAWLKGWLEEHGHHAHH